MKIRIHSFIGLLGSWILLSADASSQQPQNQKHLSIPVILNILEGSPYSPTDALQATAKANDILKQANVRIQPVKLFDDVNAEGKAPADNANLDDEEADGYVEEGWDELDEHQDGEGIKIYFACRVKDSEPNVVGMAPHGVPVAFVGKPPEGPFAPEAMGGTLAHEICHILTIADHDDDDTDSLMFPAALGRTDTKLDPDQVIEIRNGAEDVGAVTTDSGKGHEEDKESGGHFQRQPGLFPGTPYEFLRRVSMTRNQSEPTYLIRSVLGDFFPTGPLDTRFYWLLDSDANPATGTTLGGMVGVDRVIEAHVTSSTHASFSISDGSGGPVIPIGGAIIREKEFTQGTGGGAESDAFETLVAHPPKIHLAVDPNQRFIPIRAVGGLLSSPTSTLDFVLDTRYHLVGPSIQLDKSQVNPGEVFSTTGSGFAPGENVLVWLDDVLKYQGPADASGSLLYSMVLPPNTPTAAQHYYVTMQSAMTGRFAFGVISYK